MNEIRKWNLIKIEERERSCNIMEIIGFNTSEQLCRYVTEGFRKEVITYNTCLLLNENIDAATCDSVRLRQRLIKEDYLMYN